MVTPQPTPRTIADAAADPAVLRRAASEARIRAEGVAEGRQIARAELLDWLHKKYMSDAVERGSLEGQCLLKITAEFCGQFPGRPL